MSTVANLSFILGETWTIGVTCEDEAGDPINLTGAQAVKWRLASRSGVVIDAGLGSGVTVGDATAGIALVIITPAMQTAAALKPGVYRHEFQIVTASGAVSTQAYGSFAISGSLFSLDAASYDLGEDGDPLISESP